MHLACRYGRFDMVELLVENGAFIDAQDDMGRTPLHYAAMNSHGDIARYLIGCDADHLLVNVSFFIDLMKVLKVAKLRPSRLIKN